VFPAGLPGVALVLLRIAVIGMLFESTAQSSATGSISLAKTLVLASTSLLLLCGAFTPVASVVSIIIEAIYWPSWDGLRSFEFYLRALVMISLLLLGPGAYSIDLKMFGRRLILPPE
jgi:uncharacterized membrane protein YphA (DoxX/SURF4 family)